MQVLREVLTVLTVKAHEIAELFADDEKSPPSWADPVKWKESLLR